MTRFIYLSDTHVGADRTGFQQQPKYPERLPEIVAALARTIARIGGVEFVLHGGDMIEATSDANIAAAARIFALPVPVYLCLGNHDLTAPDAVARWLRLAPQFFPEGTPEYTITTPHGLIHVVPNHWGAQPYYWQDVQEAQLSATQQERLTRDLRQRPDWPHLISTHSPVFGLPLEQTGMTEPHHAPNASFTATMTALVSPPAPVAAVLGAHNHLNMHVTHAGVEYVTTSSLIETPFECKLFELGPDHLAMTTLSLRAELDFAGEYDASRTYVQGRPEDRAFSRRLRH